MTVTSRLRVQAFAVALAVHILLVSSAPAAIRVDQDGPANGEPSFNDASRATNAASTASSPITDAHEWMSESAHRSREALEDAMDVVKKYGSKTSDYFSEQMTRGANVAKDVRKPLR